MKTARRFTSFVVCGCLCGTVSARADAVVDWNKITIQAITVGATQHPGVTVALDIAMVHAAVYDAVEAIDKRFRPYHFCLPGAAGSTAAAAAKAAHDVLVNRFPDQASSLDTTYHDYFSTNGLAENDPGVRVGQLAAASIIALRANDGSFPNPPPPPFNGGTDPGVWRPTPSYQPGPPPSFAPMLAPWLGKVTPFTLTSPSQFRAEPPPALTSGRYARNYNEVKTLGALGSSVRLPEQTELAYFWATSYFVSWYQALRDIAVAHINNIGDSARLFALAALAGADAVISSWDSKLYYVFWRPVTAIQEGENDGNPRTAGDPGWQPLINNPNYPEYTSGANNATGSVTRVLALFFRCNEMTFSVTTTNPLAAQQTRTYSRFSDATQEVIDARIYEGIHFRFADVAARRQGRQVANWVFKHYLRPIHDRHDDDEDDEGDDDN